MMKIKKCTGCGEVKSLSEFRTSFDKRDKKNYTSNVCKICINRRKREWRVNKLTKEQREIKSHKILRREMNNRGYLYCRKCESFKKQEKFPIPSVRKQRITSVKECNSCREERLGTIKCDYCGIDFHITRKIRDEYKFHYCSKKCMDRGNYHHIIKHDPERVKKIGEYNRRQSDEITDVFVRKMIKGENSFLKSQDIPQAFVDAYREQIRFKRLIKERSK